MKKILLLFAMILSFGVSTASQAGDPGEANIYFDKTFAGKLSLGMTLDQITRLVGTQPSDLGDGDYFWDGKGGVSNLDINVKKGRIVAIHIVTPQQQNIDIEANPAKKDPTGTSPVLFDASFGQRIRLGMPISDVIKLTVNPGFDAASAFGVSNRHVYTWIGKNDSQLTLTTDARNIVIGLDLRDPQRHSFQLDKNGHLQAGR